MGDITVDARGLDCPQPVIMVRQAINDTDTAAIEVLVDDAVQAENVAAMARNLNWDVKIAGEESGYLKLSLTSNAAVGEADTGPAGDACGVPTRVVVTVASDRFGEGSEELGEILIRAFVKTLREVIPRPTAILFINGGVKLTTAGSAVIDDLQQLSEAGVDILNCGTCLDYFGLKDKLLVGRVSNMFEIVTQLINADRIVKP